MHAGLGYSGNIYLLHETLRVPWSQDMKVDGGNYLLQYLPTTGDAVVIDSQMNCRYKFGLIVTEADGAAVRIQPHTPGPDDMVVVVGCVFDFSALVARQDGLVLDAGQGSIVQNKIFAEETNTRSRGVYVTGGAISNNDLQVMFINQNHASGASTGLQLGDPGLRGIRSNRVEMSFHAPRGVYFDEDTRRYTAPENFTPPEDAVGAQIYAQNNFLALDFHGQRAPGKDLVFEEDAADNTVFTFNLPNGITNRARHPTNKITPNGPVGFAIETPPFPEPGRYLANRSSFLVEILVLAPGKVTEWSIEDACGREQTISAGLFPGQSLRLEPGEKVRFNYRRAPSWRWRALR
jgi:hypothetical protein